jgi:leucyl-tRNA synthetase
MVAPLAPHIAEELWARLGHSQTLAYAQFPVADPELARAVAVTIPVQINGRTRYRIEAPAGSSEDDLRAMVTAHPDFEAHVPDGAARMVIVPDRIVNIIVS